jgi:hypothetical protein
MAPTLANGKICYLRAAGLERQSIGGFLLEGVRLVHANAR